MKGRAMKLTEWKQDKEEVVRKGTPAKGKYPEATVRIKEISGPLFRVIAFIKTADDEEIRMPLGISRSLDEAKGVADTWFARCDSLAPAAQKASETVKAAKTAKPAKKDKK